MHVHAASMAQTQTAQAQAGGATAVLGANANTLGAGGLAADILGGVTGDGQTGTNPETALTSFAALLNAGTQTQGAAAGQTTQAGTAKAGSGKLGWSKDKAADKGKDADKDADAAASTSSPSASLLTLIPTGMLTPVALTQAGLTAATGITDQTATGDAESQTASTGVAAPADPSTQTVIAQLQAATTAGQATATAIPTDGQTGPASPPTADAQAQPQPNQTASQPAAQPVLSQTQVPLAQAHLLSQADVQGQPRQPPPAATSTPTQSQTSASTPASAQSQAAQAQTQAQAQDPASAPAQAAAQALDASQPQPTQLDQPQLLADASAQTTLTNPTPGSIAQGGGPQTSLSKSASGKTDTVAKVDGAGKADAASASTKATTQIQGTAADAATAVVHAAEGRAAPSDDGNPAPDDSAAQAAAVAQDPAQTAQAVIQPAVQAQTAAADTVRAGPETVARLASQIVQTADGPASQFSLTLHPAELGGVQVKIQVGRNGEVRASLTFDNAQAAADVGAKADDLKAALSQAGFDVADNGLSFNLSGQGQSGQGGQGGETSPWGGRAFRAAAAGADDLVNTSAQTAANRMPGASSASGLDIRI